MSKLRIKMKREHLREYKELVSSGKPYREIIPVVTSWGYVRPSGRPFSGPDLSVFTNKKWPALRRLYRGSMKEGLTRKTKRPREEQLNLPLQGCRANLEAAVSVDSYLIKQREDSKLMADLDRVYLTRAMDMITNAFIKDQKSFLELISGKRNA